MNASLITSYQFILAKIRQKQSPGGSLTRKSSEISRRSLIFIKADGILHEEMLPLVL